MISHSRGSEPSPDIDIITRLGEILLKYIPFVHLQGNGIDSVLKSQSS